MTNQNIVLPAIALRGTTILPGMIVHFDVSRERSVKAIEAAMLHDQKIFWLLRLILRWNHRIWQVYIM